MSLAKRSSPAARLAVAATVALLVAMATVQVSGDTKSMIPAASPNFEAAFQGECGNSGADNTSGELHSKGGGGGSSSSNPCEHICLDLHDGTYECACFYGFLLAVDGYSCSPGPEARGGSGSARRAETLPAKEATLETTTRPPDRKLAPDAEKSSGREPEASPRVGSGATKLQAKAAKSSSTATPLQSRRSNQRKATDEWPSYLLIGGEPTTSTRSKFTVESNKEHIGDTGEPPSEYPDPIDFGPLEQMEEEAQKRDYVDDRIKSQKDDRRAARSLKKSNDKLVSELVHSVWIAEQQLEAELADNQVVAPRRQRRRRHHSSDGRRQQQDGRRRRQFAEDSANEVTDEEEPEEQEVDDDQDHDESGSDSRTLNLIGGGGAKDVDEKPNRRRDYEVEERSSRLVRLVQKTIEDSAPDCESTSNSLLANCRDRSPEVPSGRSAQRLEDGASVGFAGSRRAIGGEDRSSLLSAPTGDDFRLWEEEEDDDDDGDDDNNDISVAASGAEDNSELECQQDNGDLAPRDFGADKRSRSGSRRAGGEEFFVDCDVGGGGKLNDDYEPNEMANNLDRRRQFGSSARTTCESGGKCTDGELAPAGRPKRRGRCACPIGRGGRLCEKRIQRRVPRFSGHSYLALPLAAEATLGARQPRTRIKQPQRVQTKLAGQTDGRQLTSLKLLFRPEVGRTLARWPRPAKSSVLLYTQTFALLLDELNRVELRYLSPARHVTAAAAASHRHRARRHENYQPPDYGQARWASRQRRPGGTSGGQHRGTASGEVTRVIGSQDAIVGEWNELVISDALSDSDYSGSKMPLAREAPPPPRNSPGHNRRHDSRGSSQSSGQHFNLNADAAIQWDEPEVDQDDDEDQDDHDELENQRQAANGIAGYVDQQNLNRILLVTPDKIRLASGWRKPPNPSEDHEPTANYLRQPPELFVGGLPELVVVGGDSLADTMQVTANHSSKSIDAGGWLTRGAVGFSGCIRSLEINGRAYSFRSDLNGDALDGFDILECCAQS